MVITQEIKELVDQIDDLRTAQEDRIVKILRSIETSSVCNGDKCEINLSLLNEIKKHFFKSTIENDRIELLWFHIICLVQKYDCSILLNNEKLRF